MSKPLVAYYRVSTREQGRSGLGIDAQRAAVSRFAEAEGFEVAAEFTEIETGNSSGGTSERPRDEGLAGVLRVSGYGERVRLSGALSLEAQCADEEKTASLVRIRLTRTKQLVIFNPIYIFGTLRRILSSYKLKSAYIQ